MNFHKTRKQINPDLKIIQFPNNKKILPLEGLFYSEVDACQRRDGRTCDLGADGAGALEGGVVSLALRMVPMVLKVPLT